MFLFGGFGNVEIAGQHTLKSFLTSTYRPKSQHGGLTYANKYIYVNKGTDDIIHVIPQI